MHAFFAIKGLSPVKEDEYMYVIHCLDFWPRTLLLNQNRGMSFAIHVARHYRQKEQNTYKTVIARNPVNQMMIIRHQHQNLEETIIYLIHPLLDYQCHQHQKLTLIAFNARNLVTSLSTYHTKQDFLHFFTIEL